MDRDHSFYAFCATLATVAYLITVSGLLAAMGRYGEAINSLCSVAVGGLMGYMVPPRTNRVTVDNSPNDPVPVEGSK